MLWSNVKSKLEKLQIENYLNISDYKKEILSNKINESEKKEEILKTETESNNESEILSQDISYLFKKPWSKLSNIHKIVKIKEYIRSLDYSISIKSKIEKNLMGLLKSKKLNKDDFVYDENLGKIISIHNLMKMSKNNTSLKL